MADAPPIVHPGDAKGRADGIDWLISSLAGRQHGVVARRQLLEFAGRGAINTRVRRGRLHPLHRGVYAVGHKVLSVNARWMAAVLAVGPGAALSHRSAGQLWEMLRRFPMTPEVTIPRGWRSQAGVVVCHATLPADEVIWVAGIPVTSVSRTLLDLAAILSRWRLELAMNEAEVRQLTDRLSIPDLLQRYPRRHGSAVLRSLLNDEATIRGVTRNDMEERFVALLDAHGLPRPRLNADLAVRGRFFEVDCLWADRRLVVELDGRAVHGTRRAFEADRERDRLLLAEGWQVMRVTWRQLRDQETAIAVDVRSALERR